MSLPAHAPSRRPAPGAAALGEPLAPAYARLAALVPWLAVERRPPRRGDGWVGADELATGGQALDGFLEFDAERLLREHGRPARPEVVAAFGLHRYAWPATALFTVPYLLLRRVPWIDAAAVSCHRAESRLTVAATGFGCLPDDPAAAHPDARVLPDAEALRAELRRAAAAHLGPVLEGFRPRLRRGPRALWGLAADELTETLWYVGRLLGEEERAVAEAELLLPGHTAPYRGGAGFRELAAPDGRRLRTRDRISCCLYYTLRPDAPCVTCPRTSDAERVARLAEPR